MKKTAIALSLAATTVFATSGLAFAHGPGGARHFEKLDANKDGVVSQDEFLKQHAAHFDEADANKDGKLTKEERTAMHAKHGQARFAEHDTNKDGKLSGDELGPMPARMREHLDANKDGAITQAEMQAARPPKHHEGRGPMGDKTVTKDEAKTKATEHFAKMDANKDGKLTQDELPRGGRHHGGRGPRGDQDRDQDEANDEE